MEREMAQSRLRHVDKAEPAQHEPEADGHPGMSGHMIAVATLSMARLPF
jgi:hypothetical protein